MIPSHEEIIDVLRPLVEVAAKNIYPKPDVGPEHPWAVLVRARDLLSRLDAEGEAPKGGRYRWNEPMGRTDISPAPNAVCEASAADIIRFQKQTFPERNYTDDQALNDFVVVHWAWPLNPEGGDAAETAGRNASSEVGKHVTPPASCADSGRATVDELMPAIGYSGLWQGSRTLGEYTRAVLERGVAAGRLSGIEEEHARANSLAAEVERLKAAVAEKPAWLNPEREQIADLVLKIDKLEAELARLKAPLADGEVEARIKQLEDDAADIDAEHGAGAGDDHRDTASLLRRLSIASKAKDEALTAIRSDLVLNHEGTKCLSTKYENRIAETFAALSPAPTPAGRPALEQKEQDGNG